jgi:hypothetical protein
MHHSHRRENLKSYIGSKTFENGTSHLTRNLEYKDLLYGT